jgi:hypothetical protein
MSPTPRLPPFKTSANIHMPSSDRNSQGSMADSCGSGFEAHALAVFQRVNDGDIPGALAAARTWQQQLPCLLSSSLLQWLSSRATAAAASPAAADSAVYAEGASAFDLFASNGGNVCSHSAAAPQPPHAHAVVCRWPCTKVSAATSRACVLQRAQRQYWISALDRGWL